MSGGTLGTVDWGAESREKKERIVIQVRMVIKVIIDIVNSDNRYR